MGVVLAMVALCGAAKAPPSDPGAFTPAQAAQVEKIVHDYIGAHPEVVLDAIKKLQAQQKAQRAEDAKKAIAGEEQALKHDQNAFVAGNPNGDVTVVEFFDYNCPYCRAVVPTMQALLADDRNLRLVIKEWPIKGADSLAAAHVSLAAAKQKEFLAFHFTLLSAEGHVGEAQALEAAKKAGLDMDKLKKDMAAMKPEDIFRGNDALAEKIGIDGTPAFIIGDKIMPGVASEAEFKSLIADARKACKAKSC
jgi:protein-disulfide isomerase